MTTATRQDWHAHPMHGVLAGREGRPLCLIWRAPAPVDPSWQWLLSDAEWGRIEPMLPRWHASPMGGRPRVLQDRKAMAGILLVLRTGCRWKALDSTGICRSSTAYDRFREWRRAGVFERLRSGNLI